MTKIRVLSNDGLEYDVPVDHDVRDITVAVSKALLQLGLRLRDVRSAHVAPADA